MMNKGSEWIICDLQIQTILDDRYLPLKEYYTDIKLTEAIIWSQFISKVGGEQNALLYDSKEYFNDATIAKKERTNNYVRTFFAYIENFKPGLKLIGITDHNYYDELLIDEFYNYSLYSTCKVLCGIEINVEGIHLLVYFSKPPFGKPTFSSGLITFLSKIGIDSPKKNGVLAISTKGIFEVLNIIQSENGLYIFPHCNSNNGLFQERGKTDRTHLAGIYNHKRSIIIQANSNESITKTKKYILENRNLFSSIPICTIASDGRALNEFGKSDRHGNFQWIKAEPTFEGLRQIINEPSRVYIGEFPSILSRVNSHPTKYIKSIEISKAPNSTITDNWFDNFNINFNSELVAIIGNKGKGKSALSDILGLCGNAHVDELDFSFLNRNKFKSPRPNLAKEFNAKIYWQGGEPEIKNLDELPNLESPEKVKYIPQSFLEKLCTTVDKKVFEEELEKVIYSRLENHQKLGKGSLKEVLAEKKQSLENEISLIKNKISAKNIEIITLERKNSLKYRNLISESLLTKENELAVHMTNEPIKIDKPIVDEETQIKTQEINEKINAGRERIKLHQNIKEQLNAERVKITLEINELTQIVQKLNTLIDYIKTFIIQNEEQLNKFSITLKEVFNYSVDISKINVIISQKVSRIKELEKILDSDNDLNPDYIIRETESLLSALQDELEGENKAYQKYLTVFQEWENQKKEIIGTAEKDGTLSYFKSLKDYLDKEIGTDLSKLYNERLELLKEILNYKGLITEVYRELYTPVSEFIAQNKNELSDYNVNIDVALELSNFQDKFFSYISNGVAGSFYGSSESRLMLAKITEVIDFNDPTMVSNWVENIILHLSYDKRVGQNNTVLKELQSQLKGGFEEKDFYDFLFNMDYFEPTYRLKLGLKNLNELSPGERGALLLIFFLLLDKQDIPIIIDQPEENLDNQSVYSILVHFIKKAKERRQIIIVTHNPNLAVVCDAEQIIRMDIAKEDKNTVSVISGGIENKEINRAIVDILEGTRPAFDNRTSKYKIND